MRKNNDLKALINKIFVKMMIASLIILFLGIIGLIIFLINGTLVISPAAYILMIMMGLGLGTIAITMKITRK